MVKIIGKSRMSFKPKKPPLVWCHCKCTNVVLIKTIGTHIEENFSQVSKALVDIKYVTMEKKRIRGKK
jgi:hypothetical protein